MLRLGHYLLNPTNLHFLTNMHFTAVWLAFTAAVAVAAPAPSDGFGDVHVFRRDSVLDARDVALAEIHGVNLTESMQHSIPESNSCLHNFISSVQTLHYGARRRRPFHHLG